jgi:hypothetical protein
MARKRQAKSKLNKIPLLMVRMQADPSVLDADIDLAILRNCVA